MHSHSHSHSHGDKEEIVPAFLTRGPLFARECVLWDCYFKAWQNLSDEARQKESKTLSYVQCQQRVNLWLENPHGTQIIIMIILILISIIGNHITMR